MDQHGADAVRWFMAAGGSPWAARRVGHGTIQEVVRKTLLTYWNTVAFQALYARTSGWAPERGRPGARRPPAAGPLAARRAATPWSTGVTEALEGYDTQRAGKLLSTFVDDLSNWYVRRSRRRFWQGDAAALRTLHEVIETVTRLMAPLTPFITERVWQDLVVPVTPGRPGLRPPRLLAGRRPRPRSTRTLSAQMLLVRRLVELGRATRAESGVKTRQPLSRALVAAHGLRRPLRRPARPDRRGAQRRLARLALRRWAAPWSTPPPRPTSGRSASASARASRPSPRPSPRPTPRPSRSPCATAPRRVEVDGETVTLAPEEVIITETPREGWSVASDAGATVALDLEITPELRRAGLARDAIRLIQEARKNSGLDVADRIALRWQPPTTERPHGPGRPRRR